MLATTVVPEIEDFARGSRLIDADTNKYILLKQIIVFAPTCSETGAISECLKKLGYNVYDAAEAARNFERDFPLWLEAAKCQAAGKPYNDVDLDKLIGKYDAIVGAPATFFTQELVKAYPSAKYLMLNKTPEPATIDKLRSFATSSVLSLIDPDFLGMISAFADIIGKHDIDQDMIRSTVRSKNLLEIDAFESWAHLCDFLGKPIPCEVFPETCTDVAIGVIKDRCLEIVSRLGKMFTLWMVYFAMALSVASAGQLWATALLGYKLSFLELLGVGFICLAVARHIMTRRATTKSESDLVDLKLVLADSSVLESKPAPIVSTVRYQSPSFQSTNSYRNNGRKYKPKNQYNTREQSRPQQGRRQQGRNWQGQNNVGGYQQGNHQYGRGGWARPRETSNPAAAQFAPTASTAIRVAPAASLKAPRSIPDGGWSNFAAVISLDDRAQGQKNLANAEAIKGKAFAYSETQVVDGVRYVDGKAI